MANKLGFSFSLKRALNVNKETAINKKTAINFF